MKPRLDAEYFNLLGREHLPELIGIVITEVGPGNLTAALTVRQSLLAPNGYLHAGTIVTLADTACGYACLVNLPEEATGFTTIELKSNFIGTAREGIVECEAKAVHLGRRTQVWDAIVRHRDTGRMIATFRCTQMILTNG
jgi:1,4-dihydroxy-2-naphthoyl-CoA hydrolase